MVYQVLLAGKSCRVEVLQSPEGLRFRVDGREVPLDISYPVPEVLSVISRGKSYEIRSERAPDGGEWILLGSRRLPVQVSDPRALRSREGQGAEGAGPKKITAPMPGKVVRVLAQAGTDVESGQGVVVIEAMKMQNELKSPKAGRVKKLTATPGQAVNAGDVLAIIE